MKNKAIKTGILHLTNKEENDQKLQTKNVSWDQCLIDIWFMISKYIPPEYTQRFALICLKTATVVGSEVYYTHFHNIYCIDPWEEKWQPNPSIRGGKENIQIYQ